MVDRSIGAIRGRIAAKAGGLAAQLPLIRTAFRTRPIERVLFAPRELRTSDESFAEEYIRGFLGLAGATVRLDGTSPFDVEPPSLAWTRELHGFDWLRHLAAHETDAATELARTILSEWIARNPRPRHSPAWTPELTSRRVLNWLRQSLLLLDGVPARDYERTTRSLTRQADYLAASLHHTTFGPDRLWARIAMLGLAVCASEQREIIETRADELVEELSRQMLADGGHVTRNSLVLIDVVLALMPLRQCVVTRGMVPPAGLDEFVAKALPMLRYMRMGDGSLARFNGVGPTPMDELAAALSYDDLFAGTLFEARDSGYVRLQRRNLVVLVDAGSPPDLAQSAEAHAGCLSMEVSSGRYPVIVNCGVPGPAHQDWRLAGRATAMHSTLVLSETSSSRLIRGTDGNLGERSVLRDPQLVQVKTSDLDDGSIELQASHDGYVSEFNKVHGRVLRVSPLGDRISARDRLRSPSRLAGGTTAQRRSYAIHFHLHPDVRVQRGDGASEIILRLRNDEVWQFTVRDATAGIEPSTFLAVASAPLASTQIVVRGTCVDDAEVRWQLRHVS